jgi:eukaryotic-like serine/threonine-protein kinase
VSDPTSARPSLPLPEQIGPYRVLQVLGEGGMGVVYEAEETGLVRRRVALKVVRAGLDSREVVARFETERQALAVMNHPAIAKVLYAGTTEAGQPFFAMELVKGLPITQYCDAHRLSVRNRLELFIAVCQGVQHAHQKGLIHRDLKPSNVLVTEQDGVPQPKIIDFGIAKALGTQLTERTMMTQWGQMIGTAAYMSPEQADPLAVDIDTRSDIYSLGVLLYELLVGRLPLDPAAVGVHAFLVRLAAGESVPPYPSARLVTLGAEQTAVALTRRTEPTHLRRELTGDLDWIVLKAMEPDRTQRYETANGFANDLRRHLTNEPVQARPPSAKYRMAKFVRRHRVGVVMTGVVTVAVLASAVLTTVGLVRATRAERRAAEEAATARQVTDFLVATFHVSDPGQAKGNTLTAREILDRGADSVTKKLSGQPLLQGRVMHVLGTVYQGLGIYDRAQSLLEQALAVRERALGPADPSVAETLTALGDVARDKGTFDEAERDYHRALAIREAAFGRDNIDVATTLSALAVLRVRQRRAAEAESLYTRVLALDERVRSESDPRLARDMRGLAAVYWSEKRYPEAEALWRRTLDIQERTLGNDHPDVAGTLNNLGVLYWTQGRYSDALPFYERARKIYERTLDPMQPLVAGILNNLGETYWKLKRYDEAEPLFRRALEIKEKVLSPGNPMIAETLNSLAGLSRDQGRYTEAESLYRRALDIREKAFGPNGADVAVTLRDYAELLRRTGRARAADSLEARAGRIGKGPGR